MNYERIIFIKKLQFLDLIAETDGTRENLKCGFFIKYPWLFMGADDKKRNVLLFISTQFYWNGATVGHMMYTRDKKEAILIKQN